MGETAHYSKIASSWILSDVHFVLDDTRTSPSPKTEKEKTREMGSDEPCSFARKPDTA